MDRTDTDRAERLQAQQAKEREERLHVQQAGPTDYDPPTPGATMHELITSINELRHEISYAKYNNNDWWHSTLKRLDTQNKRIAKLTGHVIALGWVTFLLVAGVVALAIFSGALQWPTWEQFSQLWNWAK